MTWLAGRLALGSGRSELVRALLVALGGALATALLLAGALVAAVRGGDCRQGCDQGTRYRTALIDQAGLRPGVVTALVLMVIPVLVFLGMCARISAARRDRRLAAIRLAGATPGQVRLLAAVETAAPAAVGAVVGLVGFVVTKVLLEQHYRDRLSAGWFAYGQGDIPARALPTDVPLPAVPGVLVLLLVPGLCAAAAVLALRQVETNPLGVSRRIRRAPRAGGLVLLAVGFAVLALPPLLGTFVLPVLGLGAALVLAALAASGSWLAARVGGLVAARTARPALLLAGRRLQADPHGQGRALSGVVLAVFAACAASVLRAATLDMSGDAFYRNAYDLVDLGLLVSLVVAAAGLLVASCEAVLERRRTLASLWAAGVPLSTLRRAVLLQAVLPAVPALLLAAVVGAAAAQLFGGLSHLPWLRLLAVLVIALAAVVVSAVATLPLLARSAQPAELRQS